MSAGRRAIAVIGCLFLAVGAIGCQTADPVQRVILVTVDTTRADRLGCYGYADASTPNLDRFAEESTLFESAVSVVPTTLPAHSTMFTGQYPQDHGVRYNLYRPLGPEAVTLAETLSTAGFNTAAFPASQIVHSRYGLNQGFQTWVEPPEKIDRDEDNPVRGADRRAEEGVDLTLDWLRDNPQGRQFVWLHLYDPHYRYDAPFPYSSSYRDRPYDGEIAYMDAQLGRLFEALRADPRWDETAVIVVGDHGEGLYDHDERWHTILLYESTQHVPLIVRAPGRSARRVSEPVSHVDLAPTILELVGVAAESEMRGISLVGALDGDDLPRRDIYFETMAGAMNYGWQELRGLRSGDWKLIDAATDPELYDLASDPRETTNLSDADGRRLGDLRAALELIKTPLGAESDPGSGEPATPKLDPETQALLDSLGYGSADGGGAADGALNPSKMIDLEPELQMAQTAVANEAWDRVEDLCRYTLERDPTNRWALSSMVSALSNRGEFESARDHATLFMRIYPDLARGTRLLASVSMAEGKPADAFRIVEEGLERHPGDEDLTYARLVAGFEAGIDGICPLQVRAAVAMHTESGRMAILRARCEVADGLLDAAFESLNLAKERGFGDLGFLRDEPEFAKLVERPEFEELLSSDDPA